MADCPQFETQEWSLETEDGRRIQLLADEKLDLFKSPVSQAET